MSVVSIKNMLPVAMLIERLKTQYHLMEMTFLILLSFHQITDVAAEYAYTLACHLCTKCFDDKFQVISMHLSSSLRLSICFIIIHAVAIAMDNRRFIKSKS